MAKLIDSTAQERPTPQNAGSIVPLQAAPNGKPGGFGLVKAGADLVAGGEDIYKAQKVEEDRINTMAAEDAYTKLRSQQLDLTAGDTNGFQNLKGGDAVNQQVYPEWNKKFDDAQDTIASTLTNDTQRQKFVQRANVTRQQFQEQLLHHIGNESNVYSKQVYDGTMDVERRSATANWDSPNDVASSLERVKAAVDERAERNGWAPEFRDGMLLQEQGKIHAAVVQQAIGSGNYQYGEEWYKQYKDQIDEPTAKAIEVAVRNGTQKQKVNDYTSDFLAQRDDWHGLDDLQNKIMADNGLDEDRKNMLVGRTLGRMDVLERRQDALDKARNTQIKKSIDEVVTNTRAGYEPTVEQMEPIITAAKGTELEGEASDMVKLANATRKFRHSGPVQQEQYLNDLKTAAHADPTRFDVKNIGAFEAIREAQKKQVKEDPQSFAVQQGLVEPSTVDMTKPAEQAAAFAQRDMVGRGMEQGYEAPFKPLTAGEVLVANTVLKNASPDDKRKYFGDLAASWGDNKAGYSATMAQISPDDPVTAIAGDYQYKKRTEASDLIIRGQAILRPPTKADGKPEGGKLWPMPEQKQMDQAFNSYEQNAFAAHPELRNALMQTAKAIYAAKSSDEGDSSGIIDSDRWESSMKLATGGIEKYNGKALLMPYNMTKSEFEDALDRRLDTIMYKSDLGGPLNFDNKFDTTLTGAEEADFQKWKAKYAPKDSGADYDLRGAFKAGLTPSANGHWPDTYKKPNHPTFSDQSRYADFGTPGTWQGETFTPPAAGSTAKKEAPPAIPGRVNPKVTKDQLAKLPLEPLRDGVYAIRTGDSIMTYTNGKPIILDFNAQPDPLPPKQEQDEEPEHHMILE